MKKPIIGIVAKYKKNDTIRYNALIRDEIIDAVLSNGGVAIGILTAEIDEHFILDDEKENAYVVHKRVLEDLKSQVDLCDGIIFQGGGGSLVYEPCIAKYTFDKDIPTLGICAGQNNMVRALSGTIKKVSNPEKHNSPDAGYVHDIKIDKKSEFYKIVKCEKMNVNSRHKNTIDNPSDAYIISAYDDDGNIEVLEAPNKRFNMAVRFHPESLYKTNKQHNAIFKAFIDSCRKFK